MGKIYCHRLWILTFCGLLTSTAFASAASPIPLSNHPWFVDAGIGAVWTGLDKNSMTVSNGSSEPAPYNVDLYTLHDPSSAIAWSLGAGYRWSRQDNWLPYYSLGVRYQSYGSAKVKGDIEQYSLPDFTNYSYSAKVASSNWMLMGKADIYEYHSFSPYVSFGLGFANNEVSGYTETALEGITPRISPDFASKTTSQFAYNLGAGIDYILNQSFSFSLGYEYANLGKMKSGGGKGDDWQGDSLSLGSMTSNAVLFNVYYQLPFA